MHTSWWQFCQNHQVPVGVSPLLLTCCYKNKIHKCQICKIINNVRSRSLPRCKMEVKKWHWLCDCRTWELLIFTWWALSVVYFCPFWFAVFIYNLSLFLLQKNDINRQNPFKRVFFACLHQHEQHNPLNNLTIEFDDISESRIAWIFSCHREDRVCFPTPQKHHQCHHGRHQKHW